MELNFIGTFDLGTQFCYHLTINRHYTCRNELVGFSTRTNAGISQELIQTNRFVRVCQQILVFNLLLVAIFCIRIVTGSTRTERTASTRLETRTLFTTLETTFTIIITSRTIRTLFTTFCIRSKARALWTFAITITVASRTVRTLFTISLLYARTTLTSLITTFAIIRSTWTISALFTTFSIRVKTRTLWAFTISIAITRRTVRTLITFMSVA